MLSNGDLLEWQTDYAEAGAGLHFDRAYAFRNDMPRAGGFGTNWRGPNDRTLTFDGGGNPTVFLEGGQRYEFRASNGYTPVDSRRDTLTSDAAGNLVWTSATGNRTTFQSNTPAGVWLPITLTSPDGRSMTFTYKSGTSGPQLSSIADGAGRITTATWTNGLISRLTFPDGSTADYAYTTVTGAAGFKQSMLTSVKRTVGTTQRTLSYVYEDTAQANALTGIIDERGKRYATWTWDDAGGRVSSSKVGGVNLTSIVYDDTAKTRTVTNALGRSEVYQYAVQASVWQLVSVTGNATTHCPASARSLAYTGGFVTSQTNEIGAQTTYVRDAGGKETSRTEAAGTPSARTVGTIWDPATLAPSKVTTSLSTTDLVYKPQPSPPPNGPSNAPHRYWRVRFNANVAGSGQTGVGEIELKSVYGDPNYLTQGVLDSSPVDGIQGVPRAADAKFGDYPSYDSYKHNLILSTMTGFASVDFGSSPKSVNHVFVTALDASLANADPASFDVQYSETGGSLDASWSTAWSVTGQTSWSAFERRRFDRPGYTEPAYTGSPHGKHRFWKVALLDEPQPYYGFSAAEVEFRATPGGADQTGAGSAIYGTQLNSGRVATYAFDKNPLTTWSSTEGNTAANLPKNDYIGYDFGAANPVSVSQVMIQAKSDDAREAPAVWSLQYSDDGSSWTIAAMFSNYTTWTSGEIRLFTDPLYIAP